MQTARRKRRTIWRRIAAFVIASRAAGLYRWEFEKRGHEPTIDTPGVLTLDYAGLMADAAAQGPGIAYVAEKTVKPYVDEGRLIPILLDWCPPIPVRFLY